jgi:TnpA family transposase
MLQVAGSLVTGQVRASDLLQMFGREGRPTPLGQAFAEYGRIATTLHLLRVVDPVDDTYRRQMNRQLTVQESRHKLARDICHGKRGQIMQAYRTGQEDQLGALGLVLNAACSGRPATSTPPSTTCGPSRPRSGSMTSWTTTWPGSPR